MVRVRLEGVDELRAELRRLGARGPQALGAAMFQEGEQIMTDSKANYVPVDLGTLRASGHVQPPEESGGRVTVTLGYGGAAAAYAVIQHERTDFAHTVGEAKYLEKPMNKAAAGMASRLAAILRRRFR